MANEESVLSSPLGNWVAEDDKDRVFESFAMEAYEAWCDEEMSNSQKADEIKKVATRWLLAVAMKTNAVAAPDVNVAVVGANDDSAMTEALANRQADVLLGRRPHGSRLPADVLEGKHVQGAKADELAERLLRR